MHDDLQLRSWSCTRVLIGTPYGVIDSGVNLCIQRVDRPGNSLIFIRIVVR